MDTPPLIIDQAFHAQIISALKEKLKTSYIFPDTAKLICANLQKHLDGGDYAHITQGEILANEITKHLQEINHDEHLWLAWHQDPLPADTGPLRLNKVWQDERHLEARLDNYGLYRVERLPGNVGVIDIRYFHRPAWGGDTAAAAMNFLANTNALIIDLRYCVGGYPGMIALFCSYLFGEDPVLLNSIYWRDDDITQQYWTLPHIPGRRYGEKPVYVLTSIMTFSGGESLAAILQMRQRATIIGEKTDGGAHAGASYPLHPHFEVFIPIGQWISPVDGSDWEGKGITPDIPVPSEQALQTAYGLALQSILSGLGDMPSGPFKALAEEARAALRTLETR